MAVQQDKHPGVLVPEHVEPAHPQAGIGPVVVGAESEHPAQGLGQGAVAQVRQVGPAQHGDVGRSLLEPLGALAGHLNRLLQGQLEVLEIVGGGLLGPEGQEQEGHGQGLPSMQHHDLQS